MQEEEKEEVARRLAFAALALALAIALLPASAPGARTAPPDALPGTVISLDRGQLWGAPWEVIAYRNEEDFWCETLLTVQTTITCVGSQPDPRPLQITAAFHRGGPNPTTVAVITASAEVDRVRLKLVPGGQRIAHRVRPLREKKRRRAGLPHGFRFFVVAVEKSQGVRAVDAFDKAGELIGQDEGIPAPPVLQR